MKQLCLSVLLMSVAHMLSAQTGQTIIDHIIEQLRLFPQEKTYVHTDASDYAPGDRIWLKVYVVNALSHEPRSESLYAYAELTDTGGALVKKIKLICRDGVYAGFIDIPESALSGRYWVRSYTDLSLSVPSYADAVPVYIGGKKAEKTSKSDMTPHDLEAAPTDSVLQYTRKGEYIVITTLCAEDSLTLLAHCRAYPLVCSPIAARHPIAIHRDSIPQGIVSLLLLNKQHEVVAERLLFSDNQQDECSLSIVTDQDSYTCGSNIRMKLMAPDLHSDERADISISVTGTLLPIRHQPSSIVAHLLLATDVKGGVSAPEEYLGDTRLADSLLASKHWTRYDFSRLLRGDYALPSMDCETTQTVRGHVLTPLRHRPAAEATVSLIAPQAGYFATTTTDNDGRFAFPDLDFPDGTNYVLRATDSKGRERVELRIDEKDTPVFHVPAGILRDETFAEIAADKLLFFQPDGIMLDDVEVTGTRRNSASEGNVYAQIADFSFGLRKIEEIGATCLHELIRRIPGVKIQNNHCYIRAATSIYADNPAAIAIDGVIVPDEYDLDNIQMQDVARVDVFKTGTTVIWGYAGGSGVISITTKECNYSPNGTAPLNQRTVKPLGYQQKADFTSLSGPRKTLYWNPNVITDHLTMTAADSPGTCHVVVEGVTTRGRLIHQEKDIIITP